MKTGPFWPRAMRELSPILACAVVLATAPRTVEAGEEYRWSTALAVSKGRGELIGYDGDFVITNGLQEHHAPNVIASHAVAPTAVDLLVGYRPSERWEAVAFLGAGAPGVGPQLGLELGILGPRATVDLVTGVPRAFVGIMYGQLGYYWGWDREWHTRPGVEVEAGVGYQVEVAGCFARVDVVGRLQFAREQIFAEELLATAHFDGFALGWAVLARAGAGVRF